MILAPQARVRMKAQIANRIEMSRTGGPERTALPFRPTNPERTTLSLQHDALKDCFDSFPPLPLVFNHAGTVFETQAVRDLFLIGNA